MAKPILLGISGGPDSLALLHLMLEMRRRFSISLGMAHIDHGWRRESSAEAAQLGLLAAQLNIPFHLKVLDPVNFCGNMEAFCRQERLSFFAALCRSHNYQAVALAHHADDLAETVLKRLFEGASLPGLVGMLPVVQIKGLQIWRPLLAAKKSELVKLAEKLPSVPVDDKTNLDPRFLRGRFRTQLMPFLSDTFGKDISPPLCRLSAEALEWRCYLDNIVQPLLDKVEKSVLGTFLDLTPFLARSKLELKHAIRRVCEEIGLALPAQMIATTVDLIVEGKADKLVRAGGKTLHIDRSRMFIPLQNMHIGMWEMEMIPAAYDGQPPLTGWRAVLQGWVEIFLPQGNYTLAPPLLHEPYPGSLPLSKCWTDAKVPAFLRHIIPAIWQGQSIAHEFLSGKCARPLQRGEPGLRVICRI